VRDALLTALDSAEAARASIDEDVRAATLSGQAGFVRVPMGHPVTKIEATVDGPSTFWAGDDRCGTQSRSPDCDVQTHPFRTARLLRTDQEHAIPFTSTLIACSPMEPRSGWLVRPDPGDRATGRRASALKRQPALHVGAGGKPQERAPVSHRPSGSHGVGGIGPTARPRPIPEATRKGRQQDPGLPIAGLCPSARADRRRGSIRSRATVSRLRLWKAKPCLLQLSPPFQGRAPPFQGRADADHDRPG
jgi:hypothetical protein